MNALKSIGMKLAIAVATTGLIAGGAFAATNNGMTVNLPESISVGSTTLAAGQYKVTEYAGSGSSIFVFRSENGETATAVGTRSADAAPDQKTSVVLANENDGSLHLDKMFIEGQNTGFQFASK